MKWFLRRTLFVGVALLVIGSVVYAFLPKPVPVDLAMVATGPLRVTVDEDGRTRIKERYVVSSPLAGRLLRIGLDPGDSVVAGESVLTRIEPTDPELLDPRARAEAKARVSAAEAKLQQVSTELEKALAAMQFAESELARARELRRKGVITENDLEEKTLEERTRTQEYRAARFAEEIARFERELAEAALLRTSPDSDTEAENWYFEIRAPISGRVLRVFQESATIVSPGEPLVELGDPKDLEVVIDVLSNDAVKVEPGDPVLLEQWGGPQSLQGTVRLVEPSGFTKVSALGVEEQRVNVIVDFHDGPEVDRGSLGDGFRVEAKIIVWEEQNVLKVPTGALFRHEDGWAVFRIDNGRAMRQPVRIGQRTQLESQVLEGLEAGDRVVVHPSDRVSDSTAVYDRGT